MEKLSRCWLARDNQIIKCFDGLRATAFWQSKGPGQLMNFLKLRIALQPTV